MVRNNTLPPWIFLLTYIHFYAGRMKDFEVRFPKYKNSAPARRVVRSDNELREDGDTAPEEAAPVLFVTATAR
jgi:hypothetical protein